MESILKELMGIAEIETGSKELNGLIRSVKDRATRIFKSDRQLNEDDLAIQMG